MIHLLLFPFLFLTQAQNPTTYYISSIAGTDTPTCGNQTYPCLSINHTLGLSLKGINPIVIKLAAGVFSGPKNTQISLGGTPSPPLTILAEGRVVVDFQNLTAGWTFTSYPSNLDLLGITFTRMLGKGVSFSGSSSESIKYIISKCSFDNNYCNPPEGSGLDVTIGENIEMIIDQCYFSNNYAPLGLLEYSYGPLYLHSGAIQVQHCVFLNNTVDAGPLTIIGNVQGLVKNCTFRNNVGVYSASIYSSKLTVNAKKILLLDLLVEENKAFSNIMFLNMGQQTLLNSRIINNKLITGGSGALSVKGFAEERPEDMISVLNCTISQNSAPEPSDRTKLSGAGLQCSTIKMDNTGTAVTNNKWGNFSNASIQISCFKCPGCDATPVTPVNPATPGTPVTPVIPPNESNPLLWLLLLLFIPVALGILGLLYYLRRQRDYKAIPG